MSQKGKHEFYIRQNGRGLGWYCERCRYNQGKNLQLTDINAAIEHMEEHLADGGCSYCVQKLRLEKKIQDEVVTSVTVHYAVSNGGDGSASVFFFRERKNASRFDENQDEGWGESSDNTETLYFDKDGKLINCHESENLDDIDNDDD